MRTVTITMAFSNVVPDVFCIPTSSLENVPSQDGRYRTAIALGISSRERPSAISCSPAIEVLRRAFWYGEIPLAEKTYRILCQRCQSSPQSLPPCSVAILKCIPDNVVARGLSVVNVTYPLQNQETCAGIGFDLRPDFDQLWIFEIQFPAIVQGNQRRRAASSL